MAVLKNIIRQQTVHFRYNGRTEGFALQQAVGEWCHRSLLPQIEQQLEHYCLSDWHQIVDRLEITVEATEDNWQEALQRQVGIALEEKLVQLQTFWPTYAKATVAADRSKGQEDGVPYERPPTYEAASLAAHAPLVDSETSGSAAQANTGHQAAIAQRQQALVLYFLQWGHLPWWADALLAGPFPTFLQRWLSAPQSDAVTGQTLAQRLQGLAQALRQNPSNTMVERLLHHLPHQSFLVFAQTVFPAAAAEVEGLATLLEELSKSLGEQRQVARKAVFQTIRRQTWQHWLVERLRSPEGNIVPPVLEQLYTVLHGTLPKGKKGMPVIATMGPVAVAWQQLIALKQEQATPKVASTEEGKTLAANAVPSDTEPTSRMGEAAIKAPPSEAEPVGKAAAAGMAEPASATSSKSPQQQAILEEGIFIENAGLVIAAPFLPALFGKLKLAGQGILLNPSAAVALAQHLVTGQTTVQETELLLPKLLCGLEPDAVVDTNRKITAPQKKEAEQLLASLIEHWAILKNTSVQGLREAFLQRNGKLSLIDNQWLLRVEQKGYDMLLQQLPWNIGMIKLPWMGQVLKTEWV
jgi:predicted transcriptional regulator